mgnify:CR=1 FL=1
MCADVHIVLYHIQACSISSWMLYNRHSNLKQLIYHWLRFFEASENLSLWSGPIELYRLRCWWGSSRLITWHHLRHFWVLILIICLCVLYYVTDLHVGHEKDSSEIWGSLRRQSLHSTWEQDRRLGSFRCGSYSMQIWHWTASVGAFSNGIVPVEAIWKTKQ